MSKSMVDDLKSLYITCPQKIIRFYLVTIGPLLACDPFITNKMITNIRISTHFLGQSSISFFFFQKFDRKSHSWSYTYLLTLLIEFLDGYGKWRMRISSGGSVNSGQNDYWPIMLMPFWLKINRTSIFKPLNLFHLIEFLSSPFLAFESLIDVFDLLMQMHSYMNF